MVREIREFHSDLGRGGSAVLIEEKAKLGEGPHFSSNVTLFQSKCANIVGFFRGGC